VNLFTAVQADLALPVAPQLASWDAADTVSRRRLTAYLQEAERLLAPVIDATADPLGLHLDIGLPADVDILHERDLDNYLLPLARHLARVSGRTFTSVTGVKRHTSTSYIGVGQATPAPHLPPLALHNVRTTASAETTAYKEQIRDTLAESSTLPAGPVTMDIVFSVGPTRSWVNLWKPTIDALGRLLGDGGSGRPWNPQDGRIVRLGLHRHADVTLGHNVELLIAAAVMD
jgi:hypothetical protein